jgi:hypothetical protein
MAPYTAERLLMTRCLQAKTWDFLAPHRLVLPERVMITSCDSGCTPSLRLGGSIMVQQSDARQGDPILGRPRFRFSLADLFWFMNWAAVFLVCQEWLPRNWVFAARAYVSLAISLFIVGSLRLVWLAGRGICAEGRRTHAQ